MSDDKNRAQELKNARSKKARYEQQKRDYETKISSNKKKITRLREAKRALGDIKDRLKEAAKSQKKSAENEDTYFEWQGANRTTIQDIYAVSVPSEYTIYINRVDIALDTIVAQETKLENDNLEMLGLVGELAGWINSLIGKIEQLCN